MCGLQVTVFRDAEVQDISIFDLLVGDVMLFETGDILPADAVIITGNTIRSAVWASSMLCLSHFIGSSVNLRQSCAICCVLCVPACLCKAAPRP